MKAVTRYKCEKCGTDYISEEDAIKCEASHIKPIRIQEESYHAYSKSCKDKSSYKYPYVIQVDFEDGGSLQYKRY